MIDLKKLKEDTNRALEIVSEGEEHYEAVNYGDLRCSETRYIINDEGETYYEVIIDEASPVAYEFRRAVCDVLFDVLGYDITKDTIEVITEW